MFVEKKTLRDESNDLKLLASVSPAIAFQPTTVRSYVYFFSRISLALLESQLVHFQGNSNIQCCCILLLFSKCCF